MQDTDNKSWIEQLEVTGPIKSIMGFVDELSNNYDRRVAAMHADYQKDIEDILECYKNEKQEFSVILDQQRITIKDLETELNGLKQSFKVLSIEYKMSQECLETTKQELAELTKVLKKEEELIALAKERIRTANEQIKSELVEFEVYVEEIATDEDFTPVIRPKKTRFSKTREFFQYVMRDRLTRPVILRSKQEPILPENFEDQDTFSY